MVYLLGFGIPTVALILLNVWFRYQDRCLVGRFGADDSDEIYGYIRHHRGLSKVLREAEPLLREIFGRTADLRLEVMHDPDDYSTKLWLNVHSPLPYDRALLLLGKFDESWLPRGRGADSYLVIDVEPVPA